MYPMYELTKPSQKVDFFDADAVTSVVYGGEGREVFEEVNGTSTAAKSLFPARPHDQCKALNPRTHSYDTFQSPQSYGGILSFCALHCYPAHSCRISYERALIPTRYVAYSVSLSVNILDDTVIDTSVVFFLGKSRAVVERVYALPHFDMVTALSALACPLSSKDSLLTPIFHENDAPPLGKMFTNVFC